MRLRLGWQIFAAAGCLLAWGCAGGLELVPVAAIAYQTGAKAVQAARPISDSEEYYVGRAVAARILSTYSLSQDDKLTRYVNEVGLTVARKSSRPDTFKGYHFAVLDSPEPNAFACPGGIIFVTRGMIGQCANEDELAAVLAHEVAHVANKDGVNSISKARWTEVLTTLGTETVKTYGGVAGNLVTLFEGSIDDVFKTIVVNGYSRSAEEAADRSAAATLAKAGYNPSALTALLTKMNARGEAAGGIFKTHPPTSDRLAKAKAEVADQPVGPKEKLRAQRFKSMKI